MNYKKTKNRKPSNAEIVAVALIATGYFDGNIENLPENYSYHY